MILALCIPQYPMILITKVVSEIIDFVFESKVRSKFGFSATSTYWTSKGLGKNTRKKKLRSQSKIVILLSESIHR